MHHQAKELNKEHSALQANADKPTKKRPAPAEPNNVPPAKKPAKPMPAKGEFKFERFNASHANGENSEWDWLKEIKTF